jgi:hypothetical protein
MKKIVKICLVILVVLFVVDRYTWMPQRVKGLWMWEDGLELGDPISYEYSFILKESEVVFLEFEQKKEWPNIELNRKGKFYLLGCYFGKIYFFEKKSKKISIYVKK